MKDLCLYMLPVQITCETHENFPDMWPLLCYIHLICVDILFALYWAMLCACHIWSITSETCNVLSMHDLHVLHDALNNVHVELNMTNCEWCDLGTIQYLVLVGEGGFQDLLCANIHTTCSLQTLHKSAWSGHPPFCYRITRRNIPLHHNVFLKMIKVNLQNCYYHSENQFLLFYHGRFAIKRRSHTDCVNHISPHRGLVCKSNTIQ